ncbi:MAG: NADH-quinone oxidoreductase subunit E [Pseudomonadota bacterium]
MSVRRLHPEQPESFAFTPANAEWAKQQISKYPEGRQASAVIPLLWRGQEQEGWVTRPMIEEVASMLGLADIRVLEVATFYFMFQLQPVGSAAHIQVCGTTSCMICGAEDLVAVCKEKIAPNAHQISDDGKLSWEEVECLGACSNAPMAQIGKDYYEDLTEESLGRVIDDLRAGHVPPPGPQNGRWASEPVTGLTSLKCDPTHSGNASRDIAAMIGDTVKRIDGTDPAPRWETIDLVSESPLDPAYAPKPDDPAAADAVDLVSESPIDPALAPKTPTASESPSDEDKPELLSEARDGAPDNLKQIKGIGPKLERLCNELGVWHFDQIASWSEAEVAWVDDHLEGFKGRIVRDDWVAQARMLAGGGETDVSA